MDLKLVGKVALVTGGSHGIGEAICETLVQEGCTVVAGARGFHGRYNLVAVAERLGCSFQEVDVTIPHLFNNAIRATLNEFGKIDILVNNAGGGGTWDYTTEWSRVDDNVWDAVLKLNFQSMITGIKGVLPQMIENGFGRVVTISSIYGKENGGLPWFQAAKSAQISAMKAFAANPKYAIRGITFNTVCPGHIDIGGKPQNDSARSQIPAKRFGTPDEIAAAVAFLCSEQASFINGEALVIDGGQTRSF